MKVILVILAILQVSVLISVIYIPPYYSGVESDNTRGVRIRDIGGTPYVITQNNGSVLTTEMTPAPHGFAFDYWANIVNPSYHYVGFREQVDSTLTIYPIFYEGTGLPNLNNLTPANSDPTGDCIFTNTNLDITNTFVATSADKFYFGLVNNGGGFPVSSGFTFFSYMAVIINPATDNDPNPTVWGLMYTVDVAGVVSPGLYRITGQTISDMARIGDIETQIDSGSNLLILSCNKSDLNADPLFSDWYSLAQPTFAGTFMTNKISLSEGVLVADEAIGYNLTDIWFPVPQEVATSPILSNASVHMEGDSLQFEVDYFSGEAYFPLTYEVVIDNQQHYPMSYTRSLYYDWSSTMRYTATINASDIEGWSTATFSFSADNISFSDTTLINTANSDDFATDTPQPLITRIYPNPVRDVLYLDMAKTPEIVEVHLYNLKGQRIFAKKCLSVNGKLSLDLKQFRTESASGLYFLKVLSGQRSQTARIVIVR